MSTAERILEHKYSSRGFTIHLSDGRAFDLKAEDYGSLNRSGKGSHIRCMVGARTKYILSRCSL
jgi:hypothetical protein